MTDNKKALIAFFLFIVASTVETTLTYFGV